MSSRGSLRRGLAALAAISVLGGGALAAVGPSTARAAPQSPPTTRNLLSDLINKLLTPTSVPPPAPVRPPAAPPAPPKPVAGAPAPGPVTSTTKPPDQARVVPVDAQALINSIRRTGGRSTGELMNALHQLIALGLSPAETIAMGMGHFPVGGEAAYSDDFLMPRFNPTFHLHQGNDIFAARGTPVRAPNDGIVHFGEEPVGGKAAYVTLADGTYYYMAHVDSFAKNFGNGSRVKQGDVVAFVGDTGNAKGTPHLHFEIHPHGGAAVNPKPTLDQWLNEALANVPKLVAQYTQVGLPQPFIDTGLLRRFDDMELSGSDSDLFLSAGTNADGVMRLSDLRARRGMDSSRIQAALVEAWRAADETSLAILAPVTPTILQAALVGDAP